MPKEITGPLTLTTLLTSWPEWGAHIFTLSHLTSREQEPWKLCFHFLALKLSKFFNFMAAWCFGGTRLFTQHTLALLSTYLDQVLAKGSPVHMW